MELIDKQAAIDEISRWLGYLDDDMILRIQIGLRRLPSAQPERKWILCSERLPKPGYCITSNEYNGVSEDFYYDGHFWNADKNAYEVIAWMPLPEPYAEKKTKETDYDYERAVEQLEHDILYEPTFNQDDGSM